MNPSVCQTLIGSLFLVLMLACVGDEANRDRRTRDRTDEELTVQPLMQVGASSVMRVLRSAR